MTLSFVEATREKTKARIALAGPAGAGKTRWALEIALVLAGPGGRIAVIDTENKSASLYVGVNGIKFQACNLETFEIQNYLDAIALAERMKFDVIVVDSLSHAWAGEGGALEQVDKLKGNNAFTNGWGKVTPLQNKLNNALTQCSAHLITTLQQHQEYVLEEQTNRQGKTVQVPVRKGLAAVQRKGMEYLFSIYAEIDLDDHGLRVTKSRLDPIKNDKYSVNSLHDFACAVRDFHESGAEPTSAAPAPVTQSLTQPQHPANRPSSPIVPSAPPANRQAPQQTPRPLPTTLSKNFPVKAIAGLPFTTISSADLDHVARTYRAKLNEPGLNEHHRAGVQGQLDAAEAILQEREKLTKEMSESNDAQDAVAQDDETGEVTHGPADDFRGQAASLD